METQKTCKNKKAIALNQPVSRSNKLYWVWDAINIEMEQFETEKEAQRYIQWNFIDKNEGIHPDIESVVILKQLTNTEVKSQGKNLNGEEYHKVCFEPCEISSKQPVSGSLPTGTPRYCMECGSRIIKEELYCEYCRRHL